MKLNAVTPEEIYAIDTDTRDINIALYQGPRDARSPHRPMINGRVNGRRTINEKEDLLMSAKISD